MNNLIIGSSSQLAQYFPSEWERISGRNICLDNYQDCYYERIFICFAEQRTFLTEEQIFMEINVDYTRKIIDFFAPRCQTLIFYSTTELWNNCEGPIDINTPYNYIYSPYIKSKEIITQELMDHYPNVIIIYPFNFNSPYRRPGFLFGKIFNSLLQEVPIEIGDTHFYRDLIHPRWLVERSCLARTHELVGSGRLTHVNDFIHQLYQTFQLDYNKLVTENIVHNPFPRKIFYQAGPWTYQNLISDTVNDLLAFKNSAR